MILQEEEKQHNRETRHELNDLFNEYCFEAINPSNEDLAQLEVIRQKIHDALIEKFLNIIINPEEQHLKCLSNLAQAGTAHGKVNQSRIVYLSHLTKGHFETDDEMMKVTTNFYQDLYNISPIDTSYCKELFVGISTLDQNDIDFLEWDITIDERYDALKAIPLE